MIKKKAEASTAVLVGVIGAVLGLIVLLSITMTQIGFLKNTDDQKCTSSLMLHAISKTYGKPWLEPECQHKKVTITNEDIGEKSPYKKKFTEAENSFESLSFPDPDLKNEYVRLYHGDNNRQNWILGYIFAEQLRKCWGKVGEGNFDLFNDLETFIEDCAKDHDDGKDIVSCDKKSSWDTIWLSFNNLKKVPAFCVLCSRIKNEDIPIDSLDRLDLFLAYNRMQKEKYNYLQFLITNTFENNQGQKYLGPEGDGIDLSKPQAIVYVKERRFKGIETSKKILDKLPFTQTSNIKNERGEEVDYLQYTTIVPYEDLADTCTYVVG